MFECEWNSGQISGESGEWNSGQFSGESGEWNSGQFSGESGEWNSGSSMVRMVSGTVEVQW